MSGNASVGLIDDAEALVSRARCVALSAGSRADKLDFDGAFPEDDLRDLNHAELLLAPFPHVMGGTGLGKGNPAQLRLILTSIGSGSLALGRLYEGHINAVALVSRYGTEANLSLLHGEAQEGRLTGVWMAGEPLFLVDNGGRSTLRGRKVLCSGTGSIRRPLVAAQTDRGSVMVIPAIPSESETDVSGWTSHGMRATATGSVNFTGIVVDPNAIVGQPGDYLRSPYFRGGAWRVLAVQLGGVEAIMENYTEQLAESPHSHHPIQLARFGEALIAAETARLWVDRAARVAESGHDTPEALDAYVDLARNAFEQAALRVIALAQKAIGLKAFLRPNPMERIARDLTTYLRQPALDASLTSAAAFNIAQSTVRR